MSSDVSIQRTHSDAVCRITLTRGAKRNALTRAMLGELRTALSAIDRAIRVATATGIPLRIAAKVDRADELYFRREIEPLLDHPLIEYIGEIEESQKDAFIGHARALMFPIDWPEPFGLVMIEALACGTPVIAWRCGSVPEVIEHGRTGFIVEDTCQAIEAARRIDEIDRGACRRAFESRFTARRMAERYIEVYAALDAATIDSTDTPAVDESPELPQ